MLVSFSSFSNSWWYKKIYLYFKYLHILLYWIQASLLMFEYILLKMENTK